MQLKKYYLIECVLCFMRLPCISFVHTPCLPCICSFCSFALLFVRSPDLCLFNHQFAFSLFIHSFAFSFCWVTRSLFLIFLLTRFLSLSLTHSFLFSFILFVSVTRSLSPFFTHSFVFSCFLWLPRSFVQIFAVNISLYLSSFFFIIINFISCHPRVVPFSLGLLACLFVRHSVAFWFPDPLSPFLSPSPSSFFSSSVLLSSPLFLFAIFSCWTRKGTYHISILQKDVLLKKIFIKLFIRHTSSMGLLFVFFYLIFTVGGKKPCIGDHFHIWLKSWLAQTTHTPTPWFNRFAFSHRSSDRNKPGPWERDRLIFFLGAVMTDHSRLQVFKFVLFVVNDDVIDIK